MQLIVMKQHQKLIDRPAVQTHHQARQNQRDRREAFTPGDAKHQRPHDARARQRGKLAG
ncbi:hypothetical protein D3C78_1557650 [compost metagenome]